MTTTVRAADCVQPPPLAGLAHIKRRCIPPDGAADLKLNGGAGLLYVQEGVLAVHQRSGRRALPGEWLRARGGDSFLYANASRSEQLLVCELVLADGGGADELVVEQRYFSDDEKANQLCPVATEDGDDTLALGVDATVCIASLGRWSTVLHDLAEGRAGWVWVLAGDASVNNEKLETGASAFIVDENEVRISGGSGADVVLLEGLVAGA